MPAEVEVMYWREIPAAVRARGPFASHRAELPSRFAKAISKAAHHLGITDSEEMWAQYYWKPIGHREGSATYCADTTAAQLDKEYPPSRLNVMVELAADYEHVPPKEVPGREITIPR